MGKSYIAAMTLIASIWTGAAAAQTLANPSTEPAGADQGVPTLILPHELTSPLTSGPDGENGRTATQVQDAAPEAPYSVEGEETLEPDSN